ncbi:beta strand repeat-containing protein [Bacilliculturomica massiliensis]|uniref:beta strand repeat-containing protein n=1 Tax=Bacilliculturomica massiliensis TaxID=1917867 RepID=UPI0010324A8B|nr:InlB B-repeat-containing protein [Bacilliculturomica massiliensis]
MDDPTTPGGTGATSGGITTTPGGITDEDQALLDKMLEEMQNALLMQGQVKSFPEGTYEWYVTPAGVDLYELGSAQDLRELAELVNGTAFYEDGSTVGAVSFDGATLSLTATVDLSGNEWIPVGDSGGNAFSGHFDGNGNTVTGMSISAKEEGYYGLFGYLNKAVVEDVTVGGELDVASANAGGVAGYGTAGCRFENCTSKVDIVNTKSYTGGVIGRSAGGGAVISNCVFEGTLKGAQYTGGIAGNADGQITNCENGGNVASTSTYVGGIAGNLSGSAESCVNGGAVSTSSTSTMANAGGIAGAFSGTVISSCVNREQVTGGGRIGGIAGYASSGSGKIKDCENSGAVTSTSTYAGGIVGNLSGSAENCTNSGEVSTSATDGSYVGGIAGYFTGKVLTGCVNQGAVGSEGGYVGGISGYFSNSSQGKISRCANTGDVQAGDDYAGGVAGYFYRGVIEDCYASGRVSGAGISGGIAGYTSADKGYCTLETSFYYNASTPLKISGNAEIGDLCFYLDTDGTENGYGGMGRSAAEFTGNEILYWLNGASSLENVWKKGTLFPEFADQSSVSQVYRVSVRPNSADTAVTASVSGITAVVDASGALHCYVTDGAVIAIRFSGSENIFVKDGGTGAKTQVTNGVYECRVNGGDVVLIYGSEEELDESIPTIYWYDTMLSEYTISTEGELRGFAGLVSGGITSSAVAGPVDFAGKTVRLGGDIVCGGEWKPAGSRDSGFAGIFDGGGHTVSGVAVGSASAPDNGGYAGFFANNNGGTIRNLQVVGTIYTAGDYAGGIAAYNTGVIQNCTFGAMNARSSVSGGRFAGGIAGYNTAACRKLFNYGEISGSEYVGGLIGSSTGNIGSSGDVNANVNYGGVSSTGDHAGGICGKTTRYLYGVSNTGNVSGGGIYTGGLVGYSSSITDGNNEGAVSGRGNYTGGLAGYASGTITRGSNGGTVAGGGDYTGGLAGYAGGISTGSNSGAVTGAGKYTGGGAGWADGAVTDMKNSGNTAGGDYTGGVAGYAKGSRSVVTSVSLADVTGQRFVGGLAGYAAGSITGAKTTGYAVTGSISGTTAVGGIAGQADGTITTVGVGAAVVSGSAVTGGVAGTAETITYSYSLAEVRGTDGGSAGGLVGSAPANSLNLKGCFYYNAQTPLPLAGETKPGISDCYRLPSPGEIGTSDADSEIKSAEQFASGLVSWLMDGGAVTNAKTYWTQETGTAYPQFGGDPVLLVTLAPGDAAVTGSSIMITGGAVSSPVTDGSTQSAFAVKEGRLKLEMRLEADREAVITPAVDMTYADPFYEIPVMENRDYVYHFSVRIIPDYAWYTGHISGDYEIGTEQELKGLSNLVNGLDATGSGVLAPVSFAGERICLTSDVAMKSGNWTPVGVLSAPFEGTFDGQMHGVHGLKISSVKDHQGLFGYISGGAIQNLTVSGTVDCSGNYTGGVVGCAAGSCTISAVQFGRGGDGSGSDPSRVQGAESTGGILGGVVMNAAGQRAVFENCRNLAAVTGTGEAAGGIAGRVTTNSPGISVAAGFTNCENLGSVNGGADNSCAGGVAGLITARSGATGYHIASSMSNCTNSGIVAGVRYAGGIAGYLSGSSQSSAVIGDCTNMGTVNAAGSHGGGVAGYAEQYVSITGCSNGSGGTVTGAGNYTGGVTAYAGRANTVEHCGNYGAVNGSGDYTGGIAGYMDMNASSTMQSCENSGSVTGKGSHTGGILGYVTGSGALVKGCANTGSVDGAANVGGIAGYLALPELKYCVNEGGVTGSKGPVGGIIGKVDKTGARVRACYNTEAVRSKGGGAAGGITGENGAKSDGGFYIPTYSASSSVENCYNTGSIRSSKGGAGGITGLYYELNVNSYSADSAGADKKYVTKVSVEQVLSGELAYLLDGGAGGNRTADWSQGVSGPVFAGGDKGPVYRLSYHASGRGTLQVDGVGAAASGAKYAESGSIVSFEAKPEAEQKLLRFTVTGAVATRSGLSAQVAVGASDGEVVAVFAGSEVPEDAVVVNFDANGGQFAGGAEIYSSIISVGERADFPTAPERDGFQFGGWYDAKSGGSQVPSSRTFDADATVYARWSRSEGAFAAGTGEPEDPFILKSAADFDLMAAKINGGSTTYAAACYQVDDGADTIALEGWEAAGTSSNPFAGVFDGNGAVIRIQGSAGLFHTVGECEISNFTVEADIAGGNYVGAVVNYFTGSGGRKTLTLKDITVTGRVSGASGVAGLVGGSDSNRWGSGGGADLILASGCTNTAEIYGSGGACAGLVGYCYADHQFEDCTNMGDVTAEGTCYVGYSNPSATGGLAGWFMRGMVERCANYGDISGVDVFVGGLMGGSDFSLSGSVQCGFVDSYNVGNVSGKEDVGGLAGRLNKSGSLNAQIRNCYNKGVIRGESGVGIFASDAGSSYITVTNSYGLSGSAVAPPDGKVVTMAEEEQFASGELAYLLDGGGTPVRSGLWTQSVSDGYPILGRPAYYKLDISGNEGLYTVTVTGTDGRNYTMEDGVSRAAYMAGDQSSKVMVKVKGKTVTETVNGVVKKMAYRVKKVEWTPESAGGSAADITAEGAFLLSEDGRLHVTVALEIQEEEPQPDSNNGHGSSGNGSGTGQSGTGTGAGTSGSGSGAGAGTEGTPEGQGQGGGTAPGAQEGSSQSVGTIEGGAKNGSETSTTVVTEEAEDAPEAQSVAAAAPADSGGLEEGASGALGTGEEAEEEQDQDKITIWEVVRQTIQENPWMVLALLLAAAMVAAVGGYMRIRKQR